MLNGNINFMHLNVKYSKRTQSVLKKKKKKQKERNQEYTLRNTNFLNYIIRAIKLPKSYVYKNR